MSYAGLIRSFVAVAFLASSACSSDDGGSRPCTDCTLAEAASQAGVWIGAAIDSPPGPAEEATVPLHFNSITAENAMKWASMAPTVGNYDFSAADTVVDFAEARGVRLRGHTLVWRMRMPRDLSSEILGAGDPAARMEELLEEHITTVVGRYRGRVPVWDVVNEPLALLGGELDRNLFMRVLGESYLDLAFELARAADPQAQLFLNEFFYTHSVSDARVAGFIDLVERLLVRGVPIDGIGIQAHFFGSVSVIPTRSELEAMLRAFTDLGLLVELTELDISINHFGGMPDAFTLQAQVYGEITAACMAVPGCQAVTTWGIDDSETWLDTNAPFNTSAPHVPLLFDGALMPKAAYFAVRDAVLGRTTSEPGG